MGTAVCINQTDHAQGHIAPNVERWLAKGPAGIRAEAKSNMKATEDEKKKLFYSCVMTVMDGAIDVIATWRKNGRKRLGVTP